MILIAIGANLPSAVGPPRATCEAALTALASGGAVAVKQSRWFSTEPQPPSGQPSFVNGVAQLRTKLKPAELLDLLHRVETAFGRERSVVNAARTLDLDLLDFDGLVQDGPPALPHPRMDGRTFVLLPLADVAPVWRHPVSGRSVQELIAGIAQDQGVRPIL